MMEEKRDTLKESFGVFLFFISLFLILSFLSYYPNDSGIFTSSNVPVKNIMGKFGAICADFFFYLFGIISYFYVLIFLILSYNLFTESKTGLSIKILSGYFLLISSSTGLLFFIDETLTIKGIKTLNGGLLGKYISIFFVNNLKITGAALTLFFLLLISLILSFNFSIKYFIINIIVFISKIKAKYDIFSERRKREKLIKGKIRTKEKVSEEGLDTFLKTRVKQKKEEERKRPKIKLLPEETKKVVRKKEGFTLPPLSLLDSPPGKKLSVDDKELYVKKRIIEEKLREFNIEGKVVEYHPGPVISTFEYKPEKGVKISQIISLSEDLSLALKAENVRISRIKGKATLGIEIPNYNRQTIYLKEILESSIYKNSDSLLTISLGKNVRGFPVVTSLDSMPHLLIAGATGMGKSVAIHSIILSILFKATPEEVNFILVDPKRLEFSVYEQLPHLKTKVVLDPKEASMALKWAIYEMEARLKKLAKFQSRNIDMYNQKIRGIKKGKIRISEEWDKEEIELMPYIVIIIDELADLMMVASKDVENSIARLAQMARAAGIHMILATQRPSIDVITGTIKNNLPSRLALTVPSRHDSQTIIDTTGAEKLLGKGDMLFMPPASSILQRVHGSYVSEEEVARVVKFLRTQTKPKFDSSILNIKEHMAEIQEETMGDINNPEFIEALKIIIHTGKASASFLQRRMKIGYNKAARYIEVMEEKGIVGAQQGSKPRDVLVGEEYLEEILKKRFSV
jgi:S-DNA-T family DNA segregation ATPase FtsK/SpoIIIE